MGWVGPGVGGPHSLKAERPQDPSACNWGCREMSKRWGCLGECGDGIWGGIGVCKEVPGDDAAGAGGWWLLRFNSRRQLSTMQPLASLSTLVGWGGESEEKVKRLG